jgi:hypothetical protein
MVTVLRDSGFRVVIFTDDHEPAHVHVYGDGEARFQLDGPGGQPVLLSAVHMKRGDIRKALMLVAEHRDALLARWREIHG